MLSSRSTGLRKPLLTIAFSAPSRAARSEMPACGTHSVPVRVWWSIRTPASTVRRPSDCRKSAYPAISSSVWSTIGSSRPSAVNRFHARPPKRCQSMPAVRRLPRHSPAL